MSSADFSDLYSPPAPVIPVAIAAPEDPQFGEELLALLDTGADGTFVPTALLEALDLPLSYMTNVRAHFGETILRVSVYKVDLILFGSVRLPGVDVVGDDWGDAIVIGRNVLNKLSILLDGPGQKTQLNE